MTHADPFILQALACHVRLRPGSRQQRRRWFARWRRTLTSQGLVGCVRGGCALVLGRHRNLENVHRHRVVNWLIEQPQVDQITVMPLVPWVDYVAARTTPSLDPASESQTQLRQFEASWAQLLAQVESHWQPIDATLEVLHYFGLAETQANRKEARHGVE